MVLFVYKHTFTITLSINKNIIYVLAFPVSTFFGSLKTFHIKMLPNALKLHLLNITLYFCIFNDCRFVSFHNAHYENVKPLMLTRPCGTTFAYSQQTRTAFMTDNNRISRRRAAINRFRLFVKHLIK